MPAFQTDLFEDQPTGPQGTLPFGLKEPPPAEFVARIRAELVATLRLAQAAATLPWPDLTQATLAELRFKGILGWLPEDEASALLAAFEAELDRLYAAEDERSAAEQTSRR